MSLTRTIDRRSAAFENMNVEALLGSNSTAKGRKRVTTP